MHHPGLYKAKKYFGTQKAMAKACHINYEKLKKWYGSRGNKQGVPIDDAFRIEKASQRHVRFAELRPDQTWLIDYVLNTALQPHYIEINQIQNNAKQSTDNDCHALAEAIRRQGLQRPIGVTSAQTLIYGQRRLRAMQLLGKPYIAAYCIKVDDILAISHSIFGILAQCTLTELTAVGRLCEPVIHALKQSTHLSAERQRQHILQLRADLNLTQLSPAEFIARLLSLGNQSHYKKLKTLVASGNRHLLNAVDTRSLSISQAWRLYSASTKGKTAKG
jgi:DNA-binding transcriptional regulator YdaS (Cro superfamily)